MREGDRGDENFGVSYGVVADNTATPLQPARGKAVSPAAFCRLNFCRALIMNGLVYQDITDASTVQHLPPERTQAPFCPELSSGREPPATMGTREVYEEKLRSGAHLHRDPTINPGLGSARCPRCLSLLNPTANSVRAHQSRPLLAFHPLPIPSLFVLTGSF
jgi:hypothetical protein